MTESERCLSALDLDRMVVGEIEGAELDAWQGHAERCDRCRERLAQCRAEQSSFAAEVWVEGLVAATHRRVRTPVLARPVVRAALAAAAVLMLVVLARGPRSNESAEPPESRPPSVRTKGGVALGIIAKHLDGTVEHILSPATLSPGEAIRFSVSTSVGGHLLVLGLDSSGQITPYAPIEGPMLPIEPVRDRVLDGSIVLDDALGPERIFLVVCGGARPVTDILAAARAALDDAGGSPLAVETLGLGCAESFFTIDKVFASP